LSDLRDHPDRPGRLRIHPIDLDHERAPALAVGQRRRADCTDTFRAGAIEGEPRLCLRGLERKPVNAANRSCS